MTVAEDKSLITGGGFLVQGGKERALFFRPL